jgi:hypothetical protein
LIGEEAKGCTRVSYVGQVEETLDDLDLSSVGDRRDDETLRPLIEKKRHGEQPEKDA